MTISNTGGTDHLSFDAIGLPGFQFIQDEIEYETRTHHSNQDVFDRIQGEDLKQAARSWLRFSTTRRCVTKSCLASRRRGSEVQTRDFRMICLGVKSVFSVCFSIRTLSWPLRLVRLRLRDRPA